MPLESSLLGGGGGLWWPDTLALFVNSEDALALVKFLYLVYSRYTLPRVLGYRRQRATRCADKIGFKNGKRNL